jgi:hypothetical protein
MGMHQSECTGSHRFFVADVAIAHDEGTASVIIVCTSCGLNQITTHAVAKPYSYITSRKQKEKENESI